MEVIGVSINIVDISSLIFGLRVADFVLDPLRCVFCTLLPTYPYISISSKDGSKLPLSVREGCSPGFAELIYVILGLKQLGKTNTKLLQTYSGVN